MSKQDFINSAESRETSPEIMEAIAWLATDYDDAVRIWEEPKGKELVVIWERVTNNGLSDDREFCWGTAGRDWLAVNLRYKQYKALC